MDDSRPLSSGSNAAARLRRSISAARAAEAVKADDSFASLGADGDDSSLVLYRDPSRISAQPSRGSVLSGAHEHGDTFFTALRKQPSWQSDTGSDFFSQAGSRAGTDLRCGDSQLNPVQSMSEGGFFSVAGGASEDGSDLGEECGLETSRLDALGADVESSYASARPAAEASAGLEEAPAGDASCSGGQLTSSVLDIIDSLYGAQPAATAAVRLSHAWQQRVSVEDQPVRDMPVAPAAAGQSGAATVQASAEAAEPSSEDASSSSQAQQLQEGPEQDNEASDSREEVPSSTESGADIQQVAQTTPSDQCQGSLADSSSDVMPADADDSSSSSADGQALLAAMDGMLAERGRLQQELGGYLQQLSSKADAEGQPLVQMSEDYNVLVERMLHEGRAQQYRALQGWEGPHRFEDLPVAQLATSHKDPEVAAGLAAIAKLDEELREASLKALVTARALNPDQYAEAEKRRLEKRAAELDAALAKERQRRSHAVKLRGVLNTLDEQCSEASLQSLLRRASSLSYYRLKPQEEELLAAVLSRDDAALEADNPFDPTLLNLDELEDSAWPTGLDQQGIASTQFSAGTDTLPVTSGAASARDSTGGAQATADAATSCEGDPQGAGPVPAAGLEPRVSDSSACVSRLGSCLSGSMWDLMRPSTALRGRRLSMAEIDAQLEALQADKELAQQLKAGQPGTRRTSSKSSSSSSSSKTPSRALSAQTSTTSQAASGIPTSPLAAAPSGIPTSPAAAAAAAAAGHPGSAGLSRSLSSAGSRIPAAPGAPSSSRSSRRQSSQSAGGASSSDGAPAAAAGKARQCSSHGGSTVGASTSSSSRRVSLAASNASGRSKSSSTVRTIDFIREQREARELLLRESEVDAQLRALQTSELPSKLLPEQLQALLQSAY